MTPMTFKPGTGLVVAAALALMPLTGCARTVQFTVMHPAMVNLQPSGNTIAVGAIDAHGSPEAAADVSADLQRRITHSLNPSIRLVADGAGVVVEGAIAQNSYAEHTETVSETCSRTVDDGTDADGNPHSHTETYDCSYDITVGEGVSRVALRVVDSAGHRLLMEQVYVSSDSVSNPGAADAAALLHRLRVNNVEQFAKVLLPWQEVVTERFKDCEGDDRCKKGFEAVRMGDYPTADALFTQVIGDHATGPVPPAQVKAIAEAFYDRGVTRAYQQRYPEAVADMARAVALQPKRKSWPQELANVKAMAQEHEALRAQGMP